MRTAPGRDLAALVVGSRRPRRSCSRMTPMPSDRSTNSLGLAARRSGSSSPARVVAGTMPPHSYVRVRIRVQQLSCEYSPTLLSECIWLIAFTQRVSQYSLASRDAAMQAPPTVRVSSNVCAGYGQRSSAARITPAPRTEPTDHGHLRDVRPGTERPLHFLQHVGRDSRGRDNPARLELRRLVDEQ